MPPFAVSLAFSGIAALAIPTGIITAGLTERIGREQGDQLRRLSARTDEVKTE